MKMHGAVSDADLTHDVANGSDGGAEFARRSPERREAGIPPRSEGDKE